MPWGAAVTFHGEFDPLTINARDATTIGIVLGELITNALKHAFPPERAGEIWAKFERNADGIAMLIVEDDGKGLSAEVQSRSRGSAP